MTEWPPEQLDIQQGVKEASCRAIMNELQPLSERRRWARERGYHDWDLAQSRGSFAEELDRILDAYDDAQAKEGVLVMDEPLSPQALMQAHYEVDHLIGFETVEDAHRWRTLLQSYESQQRELEAARKVIESANRLSGALGEAWRRDALMEEALRSYYATRAGKDGSDAGKDGSDE